MGKRETWHQRVSPWQHCIFCALTCDHSPSCASRISLHCGLCGPGETLQASSWPQRGFLSPAHLQVALSLFPGALKTTSHFLTQMPSLPRVVSAGGLRASSHPLLEARAQGRERLGRWSAYWPCSLISASTHLSCFLPRVDHGIVCVPQSPSVVRAGLQSPGPPHRISLPSQLGNLGSNLDHSWGSQDPVRCSLWLLCWPPGRQQA